MQRNAPNGAIAELIGEPFDGLPTLPLAERMKLPATPAVYFVLGPGGRVLYIGQTRSLNSRWKRHHLLTELREREGITITWFEMPWPEHLFGLEQCLIYQVGSELNSSPKHWGRDPVAGGRR